MASEERKAHLVEAYEIYKRSGLYSDAQVPDVVKTLADQGIWSIRQVASLVGVDQAVVARFMKKEERTGGRFNPATLPMILEEIALHEAGESNPLLTAEIWAQGTSVGFLARLIEQPKSTTSKRANIGRAERDG